MNKEVALPKSRERNVGIQYYTNKKLLLFFSSVALFLFILLFMGIKPADSLDTYFSVAFLLNIVLLTSVWFSMFLMRSSFLFIFSSKLFFLRQIGKIKRKKVTFLSIVMIMIGLFFLTLTLFLVNGEVELPFLVKTIILAFISLLLAYKSKAEIFLLLLGDKIYNQKLAIKEPV